MSDMHSQDQPAGVTDAESADLVAAILEGRTPPTLGEKAPVKAAKPGAKEDKPAEFGSRSGGLRRSPSTPSRAQTRTPRVTRRPKRSTSSSRRKRPTLDRMTARSPMSRR